LVVLVEDGDALWLAGSLVLVAAYSLLLLSLAVRVVEAVPFAVAFTALTFLLLVFVALLGAVACGGRER
jgi:hypothetical protein